MGTPCAMKDTIVLIIYSILASSKKKRSRNFYQIFFMLILYRFESIFQLNTASPP